MCEHFGYKVLDLQRVRIMNIELGKLKEGRYRDISKAERTELYRRLGLRRRSAGSGRRTSRLF
jgi:23S rRNA pseudouridine2604 synthase